VLGIAPTYVKLNSHGDFVRDWSWAAAYEQLGKTYYPKLLTAVPHTPAKGPRLLVAAGVDAATIRQSLIENRPGNGGGEPAFVLAHCPARRQRG
jgi:predicted N-acyltransferase